jgi:hypothetical protein
MQKQKTIKTKDKIKQKTKNFFLTYQGLITSTTALPCSSTICKDVVEEPT